MNSDSYPRTCPECGLGGPCKYVSELVSPEADADIAAAKMIMQRAGNEVVREARLGTSSTTTSRWFALYEAICECWPELDARNEERDKKP